MRDFANRTDALGELIGTAEDLAGFAPANGSEIPACGFDPVCSRAGEYF